MKSLNKDSEQHRRVYLDDDKGNITITGGQHSVGVLIRPRGKQIQAMYFAVAEGSPGYRDKKLMEYILLHSIKYTEKLESTLRYITEDYMREGYKNNPNLDFDLVFPEDGTDFGTAGLSKDGPAVRHLYPERRQKQETALLLKVSENVEGQQKMIGCMPALYENAKIAYLR